MDENADGDIWAKSIERDVAGFLCLYISCSISAAGGIGGGGLNVPIFLVVFGYSYKTAVVFSLCTVLGNYSSQIFLNWRKRHPADNRRPLIYWDAALILLPAQLGGSNIGIIIAKTFPDGILILVAMVVLAFAGLTSFRKGRKYWLLESLHRGPLYSSMPLAQQESSGAMPIRQKREGRGQLQLPDGDEGDEEDDKEEEEGDKEDEEGGEQSKTMAPLKLPWVTLFALFVIWIVYACLYSVLATAVDMCSPGYWSIMAVSYVLLFIAVFCGFSYVLVKQVRNEVCILEGDMILSRLSAMPPLAAFFIGILCTTLGIGGGELMGPLLLSLRVLPQVVSATTSTMSFINTSSNLVHYAILGQVSAASFWAFFAVGSVGGVTGRIFYLHVSQRYGRPSITIFMLIIVLILSFWLLVYHLATEPGVNFTNIAAYCPPS